MFHHITLAGSNAAGAGFNGSVVRCDGNENNCIFRNQDLTIEEQLSRGVRYLSLDICILPSGCNVVSVTDSSRLVSCQGGDDVQRNGFRYGGTLAEILRQTDNWLRNNENEVIGLHFTSNIPSNNIPLVGNMIAGELETLWGNVSDGSSSTQLSTYYSRNSNTWPTLLRAINDNQRILVFFDSDIIQGDLGSKEWLYPSPQMTQNPFSGGTPVDNINCPHLDNVNCSSITGNSAVVLSGFGFASCLNDAQRFCNDKLRNASSVCFDVRVAENRTLNVISVDFIGSFNGFVFNITSELNRWNVQLFAPQTPPTTEGPVPTITVPTITVPTITVPTMTEGPVPTITERPVPPTTEEPVSPITEGPALSMPEEGPNQPTMQTISISKPSTGTVNNSLTEASFGHSLSALSVLSILSLKFLFIDLINYAR